MILLEAVTIADVAPETILCCPLVRLQQAR
jgi:hypothetical protein